MTTNYTPADPFDDDFDRAVEPQNWPAPPEASMDLDDLAAALLVGSAE